MTSVAQWVGRWSCKLKGRQLDYWTGYTPELQARSPGRGFQQAADCLEKEGEKHQSNSSIRVNTDRNEYNQNESI